MLTKSRPEAAREFQKTAGDNARKKWQYLEQLAAMKYGEPAPIPVPGGAK